MPSPVTIDRRRRFLAAYQRGDGTVASLSQAYGFSEATGKRLLRRWRQKREVAPLRPSGGHPPRLRGATLAAFLAIVEANAQATQTELATLWALTTGVSISRGTVQRALAQAGITRRASRWRTRAYQTPAT